jgi:predicted nucleic acid-binding protein
MRLFLDTSVLLAASGSANGASREIFRLASKNSWTLVATPYAVEEVRRNLSHFPADAGSDWNRLRDELLLMDSFYCSSAPLEV